MLHAKIADIFREIADILELKGVEYKPSAYRRGARRVEASREDIEELYREGRLEDMEGVGSSMASKIAEIIETGSLEYLEELREEVPPSLTEMMRVPDLGPKGAQTLHEELGVDDLASLGEAVRKGRVREVTGFGKRSEEKILRGIEMLEKVSGRHLPDRVRPEAEALLDLIREHADRAQIAGSLRRWKETVGDIDILAAGGSPGTMDAIVGYEGAEEVLVKGGTKTSIMLVGGIQADVRLVDPESYGSAMQYFTGSKDHNVRLRSIAMDKGLRLSEYGLYDKNSGKRVCGAEEEEVYGKLDLEWVPPELREDRGEIEAAMDGELPRLVEVDEIKGDLQVHTDWSDGRHSIMEMAREAGRMGLSYIALTDHSEGLALPGGMGPEELERRRDEIEAVRREVDIGILDAIEVGIGKDGSLDMGDDALEELDMVLASVHSHFRLEEADQTRRLKDALSSGLVDILGHPTGRKTGEREPCDMDLGAVAECAADNGVALEINAFPDRLDLDSADARAASERGAMISIGTDSHHAGHMEFLRYGVGVARRAWLCGDDVLNTMTLEELTGYLGGR